MAKTPHICPFCEQGGLDEPYLALFHAWDALHKVEQVAKNRLRLAQAATRMRRMLESEAVLCGIGLEKAKDIMQQVVEEREEERA